MRLGVSSYAFNWWAGVPGYPPRDPLTPERLLDIALELGVDVVQIADNLPLDNFPAPRLDGLAARARAAGIAIEIGARSVDRGHLRRQLEIARRLDAHLIRTLIDRDQDDAIGALREIAPDLASSGITLGIENHDRFRAASFRHIVEQARSSAIGIVLDTANSLGCGEDLDTILSQLAAYTVNLHVKDCQARRLPYLKGFTITGTPAGKGMIDIPKALAAIPPRVNCILELWSEPLDTVEESIARENEWARESVAYLRPLIGCISERVPEASAKPFPRP